MSLSTILIGIGGTGAKCVEAAIHIATMSNDETKILPIVIDQDRANGNIKRLKRVLDAYVNVKRHILSKKRNEYLFNAFIDYYEELIPLVPIDDQRQFGSLIEKPRMNNLENEIIEALYSNKQLNEVVRNIGFKKRANIGSIIFEKFFQENFDRTFQHNNRIKEAINRYTQETNLRVIIYSSIFGGTGISGFLPVARRVKNLLPEAKINIVLLSPYFTINSKDSNEPDAKLVRSEKDMLASKFLLSVFKEEIFNVFDNRFFIGSDLNTIAEEYISEKPNFYGENQENKSHLFELIAAGLFKKATTENGGTFKFVIETPPASNKVEVSFKENPSTFKNLISTNLNIPFKIFVNTLNFAYMLHQTKLNPPSWWTCQPWYDERYKNELINWADRFYEFFNDLSKWSKFRLEINDLILDPYVFSKKLSTQYTENLSLTNLLKAVEQIKIRRL